MNKTKTLLIVVIAVIVAIIVMLVLLFLPKGGTDSDSATVDEGVKIELSTDEKGMHQAVIGRDAFGNVENNSGGTLMEYVPADIKSMWYRLSRREDDFCIECSEDGLKWKQMRVCHMHEAKGAICFGVYACSPEDSSFKAVFTDLQVMECVWKAHDGQQPDEM